MNINLLSSDILRYIFNFLNNKSCINIRSVCKKFANLLKIIEPENLNEITYINIFYLNLANIELHNEYKLPMNLKILRITNYAQLEKLILPNTLNTIIINHLNYDIDDLSPLNIKNLCVKNLIYNKDRSTNFYGLDKVKSFFIKSFNRNHFNYFILPENVKKIYCDEFIFRDNVKLDYLECNDLSVYENSYIKKIKITSNKKFQLLVIPNCDILCISIENKPNIVFRGVVPDIENIP